MKNGKFILFAVLAVLVLVAGPADAQKKPNILDYRSVNNIVQWLTFMLCSQGKIYEGGDKHEETAAFECCHGCTGKTD